MSAINQIVPKTPEVLAAFQQMVTTPNDDQPLVEMNDETARDINII